MKLAEALLERKHLQSEIEQLRHQLCRVAQIQEGDEPVEDPHELLKELELKIRQLQGIIVKINRTNTQAKLADGRTLMEAIAERDMLMLRCTAWRELANATRPERDRYNRREIKFVPTVSSRAVQQEADRFAKQLRELDTQIQAKNWEVELL
jgi:hypothetical protein